MKRYVLWGLLILSYFFLVGCASTSRPVTPNVDLTREGWMPYVDVNPHAWLRGSDRWFISGDPNALEVANRQAPLSAAISTMKVRVPDFTQIQANGDFQVQIFGTYGHNTVFIYGPQDAIRQTTVEMRGNTLCLGQLKYGVTSKVIIRIGINRFTGLIQMGRGCIEGNQLHADNLYVSSTGMGNIYLAGNINLRRVLNAGRGSINIFGATTPLLDVKTTGIGNVNVIGNVGVRQITHYGSNDINIIGANTAGLRIYSTGRGKIGIKGQVNLCNVVTKGNTCVYIMNVGGGSLYAYAYDRSSIGLMGATDKLFVDTYQYAQFQGRYLCSRSAFVRAHQWSHINVTATEKIFAAATHDASVYFFGAPAIMSQFVSGNGVVMPIWYQNARVCPVSYIYPFPYLVKASSPRLAGEG